MLVNWSDSRRDVASVLEDGTAPIISGLSHVRSAVSSTVNLGVKAAVDAGTRAAWVAVTAAVHDETTW